VKVTTTDAQLIRRAREDPEAFAELYRRHARAVDRYLRARIPPGHAAELNAETFAQAALSLRRFRDERDGSALPWLYGIAHNLVRTFHERDRAEQRARARLGMPLDSYELEIEEAGDRLDAERLAPELAEALGTLPVTQRRALEFRVLDDLSYAQVGLALGCSEVAARIRVTRALSSLSRRLKGAG
jgi:RNA polymerase sigma-70 factor (ECF subfamily)